MTLLFYITVSLFWGWITARFARKKGLNPKNWYIAGMIFCALAFIAVLFRRKKIITPQIPVSKPQLLPVHLSHQQNLWYYINEAGQQFGPISFSSLAKKWEENGIQENFYVWNEGLDNWKRFKEVIQITTPKL